MKSKFTRIVRFAGALLSLNILCVCAVYSQGIAVSGMVNDAKGSPLAGVIVNVQGTSVGNITDVAGKYTITVPGANSVLAFSSLGYETQQVTVGSRRIIDVVMTESSSMIEDVVVTAFGMRRESRALGYAISTVKGEDLIKAGNSANPLTTLYGKAAGVGIQSNVGGPMGGVNIKIRGAASLSSSSSTRPLFVVDGVPIYDNDSDMSSRGYDPLNSYDYGSGINDVNPEDIESMEILKGAKASVLYGSNGANGVVLITTKRGAGTRGLGVTVTYEHTIEQPNSYIDWQNEYGMGTSLTFPELPAGQTVRKVSDNRFNFGPKFDGSPVEFYDGTIGKYQAYPNNFINLFRVGSSDTFTGAISGGSDKGSMRLSYSNYNYQGILDNNYLKKNSVSFNGQMKASDFATFEVVTNLHLTSAHNRPGNWQQVVAHGVRREYDYSKLKAMYLTKDGYINEALYDDAGLLEGTRTIMDIWWQQDKLSNLDTKMHNTSNANVTLNFTPNFYFRGSAGIDYADTEITRKNPISRKEPYRGGQYAFSRSNTFVKNYRGMVVYDNSFMDEQLGLQAYAGADYRGLTENYIYTATHGGLKYPNWYSLNNGVSFPSMAEASRVRQHSRSSEFLYGVFATATLDWKGTYYLELQARNDWNSTLPPQNNSYFYPGASFTWNFSDTFTIPGLDYGKLFTSFADVGRGATRYFALKSYTIDIVEKLPDVSRVSGPSDLFAGYLKPERKRELEFGLSTRWLNNRLEFNYSFYTNNTYNQIMAVPLSGTTGADNIRINAGNVRNWGHELHVKGTPVWAGDFRMDVSLTMANQGSKVVKLYPGITQMAMDSNDGYVVRAREGKRMGEIFMYDYQKDDKGNRIVGTNGLYALDKSEMVPTGKYVNPSVLGGFMTDFFWKGVALHIGLDYRFGGTIFSYSNYYLTGLGSVKSTLKYRDESHGGIAYYTDANGTRVKADHSATAGPGGETIYHNGMILKGVKQNADGTYSPNDIIANSTAYYQSFMADMAADGFQPDQLYRNDYIKLREISIAYTLPQKWSEMMRLQKVTLSLNARNLFYLYKTLPNLDAESALGTSGRNSWHEQTFLPTARTYGVKATISF